jgi:hypothetical protein
VPPASLRARVKGVNIAGQRAAAPLIDEHSNFFRGSAVVKRLVTSGFAVGIALRLFSQTPVQEQGAPRQKIDVSKLGPQVDERVPDFSLKDQNDKLWTLQSVMGSKGAMLVFIRSADW